MIRSFDMWKEFGISPEYFSDISEDLENINIIGVDFGAGELSSFRGGIAEEENKKHTMRTEAFNLNNASKQILYTVYSRQNNGEEVIDAPIFSQSQYVYSNIKCPPEYALNHYNGLLGEDVPTYETLMERTFYCLIKAIFKYNQSYSRSLKDVKKTVVFVGRPSGGLWEKSEQEYQKILSRSLPQLKEEGVYDGQIDVIVYPEAAAALAYEFSKGNIDGRETAVIIDGGASTFDCVVIEGNQVAAEYSRQVGGGIMDENMLDLFLADTWEEGTAPIERRLELRKEKYCSIYPKQGQCLLELRKEKERYYGQTGAEKRTGIYEMTVSGTPRCRKIDAQFMDRVVYKMPVFVRKSNLLEPEEKECYPSFYEAVADFCRGALRRCGDEKGNPRKIDRIILSGGATVMPFVRETIEEVFETKKRQIKIDRTDDPHSSVAKGLAYMGGVEIKKYIALQAIQKKAHDRFLILKPVLESQVQKSCADHLWQEIYVEQFQEWMDKDEMKTMRDWLQLPFSRPTYEMAKDIQGVLQNSRILEEIQTDMEESFRQLFPNAKENYRYEITQSDIIDSFQGDLSKIKIRLRSLLPFGMRLGFFGIGKTVTWDTVLTREEKKKIQIYILSHKNSVMGRLSDEISDKTHNVKKNLYQTIVSNMDQQLEEYMESLTPYFIQRHEKKTEE